MTFLVDSHCHLDFPDFADELDQIVANARAAGIGRMVTICTRVKQFERVRSVAERYEGVYCTVGTHPHNADEELDVQIEDLVAYAQDPLVVGLGEAGLDYHYDKAPRDAQAIGLKRHIAAARETGLPLVIHARSADDDMIAILEEETRAGAFPAVLHCFSSGAELARRGIELGLYVSFSGILTFKNSAEIREIAQDLPRDRVLVETDAPYLAPVPHRGKRNEPAYTVNTAATLAEVWQMDRADLWAQTTENFFSLFNRVPRNLPNDLEVKLG